jgi:predicted CopG family antitoxin
MSTRHTVSITSNVYTRLRNHGRFGESFNDLVNRLVDEIEEKDAAQRGDRSK